MLDLSIILIRGKYTVVITDRTVEPLTGKIAYSHQHPASTTSVLEACVEKDLVAYSNRVNTLRWGETPMWSLTSVENHEAFTRTLQRQEIAFSPVPAEILGAFTHECEISRVDDGLLSSLMSYRSLYPHQKTAVRYALARDGRAMNAGEMGSGKTAATVVVSDYYHRLGREGRGGKSFHLVVCPSSLRDNWKTEFVKFSQEGREVAILRKPSDPMSEISILSYASLRNQSLIKKILDKASGTTGDNLLIVDESHYIKSTVSKRARAVFTLSGNFPHVVLLSGTPSTRPSDLFSQLRTIDAKTFRRFLKAERNTFCGDRFFFADRYCAPERVYIGRGRFGHKFTGSDREWELSSLLRRKYVVRSTKAEMLHQLPKKYRTLHVIGEATPEMKRAYKQRLEEIEHVREKHGSRKADVLLMKTVRDLVDHKLPMIVEYVSSLVQRGSTTKYLFFAHHHKVLDAISQEIESKSGSERTHVCIDGRTSVKIRQQLVDSFQEPTSGIRYAVLSIGAAGVGLNLYEAHAVVFCELVWCEKSMLQAEDRAHRYGLKHPVEVTYLIYDGTTDNMIWYSLNKKTRTAGAIMDNKKTSMYN